MSTPVTSGPEPVRTPPRIHRALSIIAAGTILALLYFARDVLVPITLAVILSLALNPLVRLLRRLGLGPAFSALSAVLLLVLACASFAVVIGTQVVRMAVSLPQYQETIQAKLRTVDELTVGGLQKLAQQAGRVIQQHLPKEEPVIRPPVLLPPGSADTSNLVPVEVHQPPDQPLTVIRKVVESVWGPIATAGVVLVVLVFALLEHEGLRDRVIRLAGVTDIRLTTFALNDAGERLSRFFVSQFAVNFGVGAAIWLGVALLGLPQAIVWGALAALLRFVPYVGVWIAALFCAMLAAAVDPGWSLAIETIGLFIFVELVAGQLVEPQLYGHTTGLSPLSVIIAAIFWSWLWGPVGLLLSTPLTVCLLVAGRHIKALSLLDILLGDTQALTMAEGFYQRALSGDSAEIIARAREFLKRNTFAAYCDIVLMPAIHLARLDFGTGTISDDQQAKVRTAVTAVIGELLGQPRGWLRKWRSSAGSSLGRQLRTLREERTGRWQGPLDVPPYSIVLGVGLGTTADDLATEILVRILRDDKVDARHLSIEDLQAPPPEAKPESIAMIYIVSAYPCEERHRATALIQGIRARLPKVRIVTAFFPGMMTESSVDTVAAADESAHSFAEAIHMYRNASAEAA
ncbi:MAG: AI-2E family transporter [Proteobacteria bacterium]|nr:AI-2E family transporter [Pseudomonadota bacterium]